jgi:hypothetical protein
LEVRVFGNLPEFIEPTRAGAFERE